MNVKYCFLKSEALYVTLTWLICGGASRTGGEKKMCECDYGNPCAPHVASCEYWAPPRQVPE